MCWVVRKYQRFKKNLFFPECSDIIFFYCLAKLRDYAQMDDFNTHPALAFTKVPYLRQIIGQQALHC